MNINNMKRSLALVFALVLLSASAFSGVTAERSAPHGRNGVGMDISDFHSVTFDGETIDGSFFSEATVTVVNLWQRWCGPCMLEMPYFLELHEHYSATPEEDVRVLGALVFEGSHEIEDAIAFTEKNGYSWTHMLICDELRAVSEAVALENGYVPIPQTLIVDSRGIVREQLVGKVQDSDELFALAAHWLETLSAEQDMPLGDLNGDGSVGADDAIMALRCALGIIAPDAAQLACGDLNGDGGIDASDAIGILRLALGI